MKKDMTEGREWSSILLFSLPIMGANLLQVLYNLADSVIVGNLISATALGAVGLTSSMTWLLTAICTSIGAGVNIAVAQYFGAKKETDMQFSLASAVGLLKSVVGFTTISVSYLIAVIASIFLTAACFLAARPVIFGFLQAPEEMRFDSMAYFLIYSADAPSLPIIAVWAPWAIPHMASPPITGEPTRRNFFKISRSRRNRERNWNRIFRSTAFK